MPRREPGDLSAYPVEYIQLYNKGYETKIIITGTFAELVKHRNEMHSMRKAMKEINHPLYPRFAQVVIQLRPPRATKETPTKMIIQRRGDTEFFNRLRQEGILDESTDIPENNLDTLTTQEPEELSSNNDYEDLFNTEED